MNGVNFVKTLKEINPKFSRKILFSSGKIKLSVKPEHLTYPEGFYFDNIKKVITNKKNVPFWKRKAFHVFYSKRL